MSCETPTTEDDVLGIVAIIIIILLILMVVGAHRYREKHRLQEDKIPPAVKVRLKE